MSQSALLRTRYPSPPAAIAAIAKVTFMEVLRDKILYSGVVLAVLLLGLAAIASNLSFVHPHRVVLDFGLSAVAIASAMVGLLMGATVIQREFDRRTVYMVLSHPISRLEFVLGKFGGLALLQLCNWALVSGVFVSIYFWYGREAVPDVGQLLHPTLWLALLLALVQALLLTSLAVFFSAFSTSALSAMTVLGLYLVGVNMSQVRLIALKAKSSAARWVVEAVTTLLPNFEHFNLGFKIVYGIPVDPASAWLAVGYGVGFSLTMLILASMLIRSKEV